MSFLGRALPEPSLKDMEEALVSHFQNLGTKTKNVNEDPEYLEKIRTFGENILFSKKPLAAEEFNPLANCEGACIEFARAGGG
jgi:hypothetical protein